MDTAITTMSNIEKQFEALEASMKIDQSEEFHQKRREAFSYFLEVGFPKKRTEEYRYLDLSKLSIDDFQLATKPKSIVFSATDFAIPYLKSNTLVFVDGHYISEQSTIIDKDVFTVGSLHDVEPDVVHDYFANYEFEEYNPFAALNIAFAHQGAYIHIARNKLVDHPIQLIHINTGKEWAQPNHLILAEKNSQASIIESHYSLDSTGIDNTFLRIVAKEDAVIEHYKLQALGDEAMHFGTTHIEQKKHSVCTTHVYNLGGGLVRNNIHIDIEDDHTEANMYGLYVTDGNDLVDNHTLVNHMKPNCVSNQLYKGVLNGQSTAIFNGKIMVQRDAQVTNAFQSNRNILLSDNATINTKPQLEIWADDVKCSHGATIGKLNQDEIFYLQSRGIDRMKAKSMLTYAFAGEVLTYINIPELRSFLEEGVALKLGFEL